MDLLKIEFGTLKTLAEHLNLSPNNVYLWGQTNVPFKYVKKICELSNGRLTAEMLRPDLFKKD